MDGARPQSDFVTDDECKITKATRFSTEDDCCHIFSARLQLLIGRPLFNTQNRRLGPTATGVQLGDLVCVLNGSSTTHVIRRIDDRDGSERYSFVGDAYVRDLMHGEVDEMYMEARELVLV